MFISVTNRCNLACQGCWVTPTQPPVDMPLEQMHAIIRECKREGSFFFGLLGGEPLLHPRLFDLIARHPDCYFVVFTNGTVFTEEHAERMCGLANVSPLVSIEGREQVSDERRGGKNVYALSMRALELCRRKRLITGVATSVCRSNFHDLVNESFVKELVERGVLYLWYYIYRPAGSRPTSELALSREKILALRRFLIEVRSRVPLIVIDAYWDHRGHALCPAAAGISYHINPEGYVEPCPVIQFAAEKVGTDGDLGSLIRRSQFLAAFRRVATGRTPGCLFLEDPQLLRRLVEELGATDTSGREMGLEELARARPICSHHLPTNEIPERHWFYRLAEKTWFFGFGAYG
ncbi:MAG: radical SAM/SPASM domain-containing protein [Kiritimatiellia bacterium]